jgi:hypothetical protein
MPVTFETDLRDLKTFDYVPQIPLEALFKNMSYKQAKYDQGFQQAQSIREGLNVKAYGQDAVRRDELLKQIDEESKKFAGADFSDKNVLAQYTNWLNSIASSPEFAGFKQRADWYDKNQAKLEKLQQDGTDIPDEDKMPMVAAVKYFSGEEEYNPNKRFTGEVYKPFDFTKFGEDIFKTVVETEERQTGQKWITASKEKQFDKLVEGFNTNVSMNAPAMNALKRKFDMQTYGVDYNTVNKKELNDRLTNAIRLKNDASQRYLVAENSGNKADAEKYRASFLEAEAEVNHINAVNRAATPEDRKMLDWQKFLQQKAFDYASNRMYYSTTGAVANPYTLNADQAILNANLNVKERILATLADEGKLGVTGDPSKGVTGISLALATDASGNATPGVTTAVKTSRVKLGNTEFAYQPTVDALRRNDYITMENVFNETKDKWSSKGIKPDLIHTTKPDPNDPSVIVVEYFPTAKRKEAYEEAEFALAKATAANKPAKQQKLDALAPSKVKVSSTELLGQLAIASNYVGKQVYQAANRPTAATVTTDSTVAGTVNSQLTGQ